VIRASSPSHHSCADLQAVVHRPGVFQTYLREFFSETIRGSQFFFGFGLDRLNMVVIGANSSGALPWNSLPCLNISSQASSRATKPGWSPSS
jgi:hypothetical protein